MQQSRRPQQGFTLLELLVALAIAGVLFGVAVPSMNTLLTTMRVHGASHQLTAEFALARALAISRNTPVTACPSDGQRCLAGSDWSDGWIVFTDPGRRNQPDSPDAIVSHHQARRDGIRIHSTQGRPRLRYLPTGMSGGSNLTVSICNANRLHARIIVNNAGRTRSERASKGTPCPVSGSEDG